MKHILIIFFVLVLFPPALAAAEEQEKSESTEPETLYVTDTLRLGIYAEAGGKGGEIRKLRSGEKLTLLDQQGRYYKVRTESGEEGWVKKFYIVKEPPAMVVLPELQKQLETQKQLIETLQQQADTTHQEPGMSAALRKDYEDKLVKLNEENVNLFNQVEQQRKQIQQLELKALHAQQDQGVAADNPAYNGTKSASLTYSAGVAAIAAGAGIILGMILGYRLYANRLKKRFYGFRV